MVNNYLTVPSGLFRVLFILKNTGCESADGHHGIPYFVSDSHCQFVKASNFLFRDPVLFTDQFLLFATQIEDLGDIFEQRHKSDERTFMLARRHEVRSGSSQASDKAIRVMVIHFTIVVDVLAMNGIEKYLIEIVILLTHEKQHLKAVVGQIVR